MRVYVVRKWPLSGRSRFVCWNITRISLWLLCKVRFVQSTQRTRLQARPFVLGINDLLKLGVCASRNHPCRHVCGKNLNIVSICAVSPLVHTSNISYSMVQSPSWEANWFAASQEIPRIFMEPEVSLPHSQASATCPYPGPAQSSPHTHIQPPGDPS